MSFCDRLTGASWPKFAARSALVLGLAGPGLMAMFLAVLGVDPSDPYSELVAAARSPAAYRLSAFLDMLVWVGIGGVLLAFAGCFAARAPIRPCSWLPAGVPGRRSAVSDDDPGRGRPGVREHPSRPSGREPKPGMPPTRLPDEVGV